MNFKRYLPILQWLSTYDRAFLKNDLVAGLTVWVMLVPQGMAYALLAGLPPIYGLYGALIPLFLYAILGTSRHLSIGPVAISSLLILAGISQIAEPYSADYISYAILAGLLIGIFQAAASLIRLGVLVNFLSHPVIAGFTSAAVIIIGVNQLKYLMGINIPRFSNLMDTAWYAIRHIGETHLPTFLLCIGGIALILIFKKINKALPGALSATILGILIVKFMNLDQQGVDIVKDIPRGLPIFQLPAITLENIKLVMPTVLTVTIIGIIESISIAKVWEVKNKDYKIDANQELLAIGFSKIGGAFFQALPTSGSFTRSAVNSETGAKTQLSSIIAAGLIALTLIFLTPLFYYLPNAILAAIILASIIGLFDVQEAIYLWKTHKSDFTMMILTFLITLILGIEEGVLAGVIFSVLMVLYRSTKPHVAILGQLPNTQFYRNISRFPNAIQLSDCTIVRFDSQLFFINSNYFKEVIEELIQSPEQIPKVLILDASSIHDVDSSGLKALEDIIDFLKEHDVQFYISGIIGPVRDLFYKAKLTDKIGKENQFMHVKDAVDCYCSRQARQVDNWTDSVLQTNVRK